TRSPASRARTPRPRSWRGSVGMGSPLPCKDAAWTPLRCGSGNRRRSTPPAREFSA
ncbi:MAG: hypothetical protein AVDCRST_MAG01-01-5127, partial [uncultured Rubrobacteraceae bacterium]